MLQIILPALTVGGVIALAIALGIAPVLFITWLFVHPYIALGMIVGIVGLVYLFKK